jgi:hypothetical protein
MLVEIEEVKQITACFVLVFYSLFYSLDASESGTQFYPSKQSIAAFHAGSGHLF